MGGGLAVVSKELTKLELNASQLKNFTRFEKKLPQAANPSKIYDLPSGSKAFQSEVPGRVPGSKAVYEKQIDEFGKTLQYTKTTYGPNGRVIHIKDKIGNHTFIGKNNG